MRDISKVRFDAMAAYCRHPKTILTSEEVRWLELDSEHILATIIRDRVDGDFGGILLARDAKERYRCIDITPFYETAKEAASETARRAMNLLPRLDDERLQDDERGAPVDFFTPIAPAKRLHPDFVHLSTLEAYSPARGIIEPMMRWYEDPDGNFIEQFQTTGFDARIWELYLYAMLVEAGFAIDRSEPSPDFVCVGLGGRLCVEATTVNPTRNAQGAIVDPPPIDTPEQLRAYQREYAPIKYGGPLTAKLSERYWERPHVAGMPLLFAIQDFHAPMAMTMTRPGLYTYLYGYTSDWHHEPDGSLVITPRKVETHDWGTKQIPSGFFRLPGAENVSAVVFNGNAALSKFNRMGVIAGFGSRRVKLVRQGVAVDLDPNASAPKPFSRIVNDPTYSETWIEGMDIFHNPWARAPLDPAMLPGSAHHFLRDDGRLQSFVPVWQPLSSVTLITVEDR